MKNHMFSLRVPLVIGIVCISSFYLDAFAGFKSSELDGRHYLEKTDEEEAEIGNDPEAAEEVIRAFLDTIQLSESTLLRRTFKGELSRREEIVLIRDELFGALGRTRVSEEEVKTFL